MSAKSGVQLTKPRNCTTRRTRSRSPPQAVRRCVRTFSAHSRAAARQALTQWHTQQPERPLWLLEKPIPLLTRQHYPYYRGLLRLVSMPERIESGWWDDDLIKRDYFIAEGEEGVRYWVYRERVSAAQASAGGAGEDAARWYLHGLFG